MPSLTQVIKIEIADGKLTCERQAEYGYDTVEIDASGGDLGRGRDQRAALPQPEGDHGGKEEAARDVRDRRRRDRRRRGRRGRLKTQVLAINPPPEKAGGEIIEDEDTNETVDKIVAWLDERKLL